MLNVPLLLRRSGTFLLGIPAVALSGNPQQPSTAAEAEPRLSGPLLHHSPLGQTDPFLQEQDTLLTLLCGKLASWVTDHH